MRSLQQASTDDRLAGAQAKQFVTLEQAIGLSRKIGGLMGGLSPRPELAVGLADGGILPAVVAAEAAGIECHIIEVRRRSSRLKRRLAFIKRLLPFPALYTWKPVKSLGLRLDRIFNQIEDGGPGADLGFDVAGLHVVIVDDCVDSGSSVAHVRARLLAQGAASVRVAVISWATKYDSQALHGVTPDIHLHRVVHRYPWALSNPEYRSFEKWLTEQGFQPRN